MEFTTLKSDILEQLGKINPLLSYANGLKQSHFILMAEIINANLAKSSILKGENLYRLGNTISPMTLRRFFQNLYTTDTATDLRFLKSVDKLAIFMGYDNFGDYSTRRGRTDTGRGLDQNYFKNIISGYCAAEFAAFANLPAADTGALTSFLFPVCPLRARMDALLLRLGGMGLRLVEENNRSSFEVYGIELISQSEESVTCETREFWNMLFRSESWTEYTYHKKNEQLYFFRKDGLDWKLWDNYNPDSGSLMERTESHSML